MLLSYNIFPFPAPVVFLQICFLRKICLFFYIRLNAYCIHTNDVYQQYKGNICNRAFKCGSELPEYVALILRNGDSQSPDRWLRELQNNQSIDPCALASSKKLIVFSCHLECGIKKLISQGAGFDIYFYL